MTVTTSLMSSVNAIVLPGTSVPLAGEASTWVTEGIVVPICSPDRIVAAPDRLAALPAASRTVVPPGRLAWVIASAEVLLSLAPTV